MLHWRNDRTGKPDGNPPRGQQKTAKRTNASGNIGDSRTRKALGKTHQKFVDVSERHRRPGFVAIGEMFEEPAEMAQPLLYRHRRVAPMTDKMLGILLKQSRSGTNRWLGSRPHRRLETHDLVDAVECMQSGLRPRHLFVVDATVPPIPLR